MQPVILDTICKTIIRSPRKKVFTVRERCQYQLNIDCNDEVIMEVQNLDNQSIYQCSLSEIGVVTIVIE